MLKRSDQKHLTLVYALSNEANIPTFFTASTESLNSYTKPFALTIGEPAGIGPDVILQLYVQSPELFLPEKIVVIGNKKLLIERAKQLNLCVDCNALSIVDITLMEPVIAGQLNKNNAKFVIDMLTVATAGCLDKIFSGIITGPIHKGIINDAGFSFRGHTDFFSHYTHCKTVMMLMIDSLKVALLTDHIPLCDVSKNITKDNLEQCLNIIIHDFKSKLGIAHPRILICGLNPHAGENGYLGLEEKNIIIPVLKKYKRNGHTVTGPVGADVAFTQQYQKQTDVILAMYHDQGLPVIKYAGFEDAINVTLGLPFIRTSVDHGTALDIAGTGKSNCNSLKQAILFAEKTNQKSLQKDN